MYSGASPFGAFYTCTLHWEYSKGATVIFLRPLVTRQRRYEWQRSLATQLEYTVDSVMQIKLRLQY